MRKLVKAWNNLPAGAAVTTDPLEQVVLVDAGRIAHLEAEGHFGASPPREIPAEVRTTGTGRIRARPLDENGAVEFLPPPGPGLPSEDSAPRSPRPAAGPQAEEK